MEGMMCAAAFFTKCCAPDYTKLIIAPVEEVKSVDLIDVNTKKVVFNVGDRFAEIEAENIQYGSQTTDGTYESGIQCDFYGNIVLISKIIFWQWLSASLADSYLFLMKCTRFRIRHIS